MLPVQVSGRPHSPGLGGGFGPIANREIGPRPACILIASSDPSILALRPRFEALGAQVRSADRSANLVSSARSAGADLILFDMETPESAVQGIRALKRNAATRTIPVIVLSVTQKANDQVRCLDAGASDYVRRPIAHSEIIARIRVLLRTRTREALLRRRLSFLEELASSNPLMSLLNLRAFIDQLHLEMERAVSNNHPLSCLVLEVDYFKGIQDRHGHLVGDDVLRQLARILVGRRREGDAVGRCGGEQFVWLLPRVGREALVEHAEALRRAVEEVEIPTAEGSFHITVSVGVSTYVSGKHGRISAHLLLDRASHALLDAKKVGKNRVASREPIMSDEAAGWAPPSVCDAREARTDVGSRDDAGNRPGAHDAAEAVCREPKIEEQLNNFLLSTVKVLTAALEAKDPETMTHSHRVASTAVAVAMELGLPAREIERIKLASLLHDLGKLAIPGAILSKTTAPTEDEWTIIRKHPERGAAMVQKARSFSHLVDLILYHQESFDGSGYPDGLSGRDIPLGARIIRVADAFDAMTSDRPYRSRKTVDAAKMELRRMAGVTLDPVVVDTLLSLLSTMSPLEVQLTILRETGLLGEDEASESDREKMPDPASDAAVHS